MPNPEWHYCNACNFKWRHGHHGGHDCVKRLVEQKRNLINAIDKIHDDVLDLHLSGDVGQAVADIETALGQLLIDESNNEQSS